MRLVTFYDDYDPDYGALSFREKFNLEEIVNEMVEKNLISTVRTNDEDDYYYVIEMREFPNISLTDDFYRLIDYVKNNFIDYDALKGTDFEIFGD